jgi:hypothetical protein
VTCCSSAKHPARPVDLHFVGLRGFAAQGVEELTGVVIAAGF